MVIVSKNCSQGLLLKFQGASFGAINFFSGKFLIGHYSSHGNILPKKVRASRRKKAQLFNTEFSGIENYSLFSSFFFSCFEMFQKIANFESQLIISKAVFVMSQNNASSKDISRFTLINCRLDSRKCIYLSLSAKQSSFEIQK